MKLMYGHGCEDKFRRRDYELTQICISGSLEGYQCKCDTLTREIC